MLYRFSFLTIGAAMLVASVPAQAQRVSACSQNRSHHDLLLVKLRQMMDTDDSDQIAARLASRLPLVSPDSIRLVTDERVCERAARAYYRHRLGPQPPDGATVVQVGDLYVVFGRESGNHWEVIVVYTKDFEVVARQLT